MSSGTSRSPRPEGPDFVGIGAQKSGTTWLGNVLDQHPGALMSSPKEISFFTNHFYRGYGWYHGFFREKAGRVAGEISVNYMYSPRPDPARKQFYPKRNYRNSILFWRKRPAARDELKAHYPGLRVFAIFRNPADRAWSHYWFWRNRKERLGKHKSVVPFEQMFNDDGRWIRLQSYYADHLTCWREAFPDMAVFFYDDIQGDPEGLARQLYRFVGVDDTFKPHLSDRVNPGRYEPMPPESRAFVIDHCREQIRRFAEMTGRDLSHWLKVE